MGKTIDDCINYFERTNDELAKEGQYCDVFEMVVDTMRKYQKIEQILKSLEDGEINYPQMTYFLREVIKDGKTD